MGNEFTHGEDAASTQRVVRTGLQVQAFDRQGQVLRKGLIGSRWAYFDAFCFLVQFTHEAEELHQGASG